MQWFSLFASPDYERTSGLSAVIVLVKQDAHSIHYLICEAKNVGTRCPRGMQCLLPATQA